ncbi:MAG TPA: hypothetical protein ENK17_06625 [Anaerolineae bacterium]|nr:hypothetical protein [Anaerolineae bacterium]
MTSETLDVVGSLVGAALTVMVLSYLLGDNTFYRFALHLFIGTLIGYSFGIVLREVLFKMVFAQLVVNPLAVIVPLVLGLLLLFKGFPRQAYIGNFSIAYLVGVGAAVAMSGALLGTISPQIRAAGQDVSLKSLASFRLGILDGLLVLLGTISTLLMFNFADRQRRGALGVWGRVVAAFAAVGRVFLTVALGVAFAGALTASLSILIGRVEYIVEAIVRLADRLL